MRRRVVIVSGDICFGLAGMSRQAWRRTPSGHDGVRPFLELRRRPAHRTLYVVGAFESDVPYAVGTATEAHVTVDTRLSKPF